MKIKYKNCEIEVTRENCLAGYPLLFYSIFDMENGCYEVKSGYSEGDDTVRDYIEMMKYVVDDYREHPEDYED